MQLYYCSLILVHLHRPYAGGLNEYLDKQRNLKKWACLVCGIAKTSTDYASSIMSSQCVFIGNYLHRLRAIVSRQIRPADIMATGQLEWFWRTTDSVLPCWTSWMRAADAQAGRQFHLATS